MSEKYPCYTFGWLPDFPDIRDYRADTRELPRKLRSLNQVDSPQAMFKKAGVSDAAKVKLPPAVDLRQWCPPVEDQGELGSCTAHAGVGMLEFYERKAFGKHIDASRLFLYKTTRTFAHLKGDSGAYLRSTMAAMVLFGVPPEEYWPYNIKRFDSEPSAFCYSFARTTRLCSTSGSTRPAPVTPSCSSASRPTWRPACRPSSGLPCTTPSPSPARTKERYPSRRPESECWAATP